MDNPTKEKTKLSIQLNTKLYAVPTPAGAFYATASETSSKQRDFLYQLIVHNHEQKISGALLKEWGGKENIKSTVKIFYRLQQLGYITGTSEQPSSIPDGTLSDILTEMVAPLSINNKVVLSDSNGLYMVSSGYPHEVAEQLAALSVDLYGLYERHQKLLLNNLNIVTKGMAMVAPDGYSQLGVWPIHIGHNIFFLILGGAPQMQDYAFTDLVKFLATKYKN